MVKLSGAVVGPTRMTFAKRSTSVRNSLDVDGTGMSLSPSRQYVVPLKSTGPASPSSAIDVLQRVIIEIGSPLKDQPTPSGPEAAPLLYFKASDGWTRPGGLQIG